jgi:hypothetical protein
VRAFIVAAGFLLGMLAFDVTFRHQLHAVPPSNYEVRDDAVITLSHARNLVEWGFIGVSPSGERIEGFSAPLQFWVAAATYAIAKFDYAPFLRWQTTIGTLLLGFVVAGVLMFPMGSPVSWRRAALVGGSLLATAWILASSRAFLLWHASGMENVYKSITFVALLWVLDWLLRTGRIRLGAIALVFAASISRVDAIVAVSMLLVAFGFLWSLQHRNSRGFLFAGASLVPWLVHTLSRRWYFGQWEPNTAIAQDIAIGHHLLALIESPRAAMADYAGWLVAVGKSLEVFQFLWLPVLILIYRRERPAMQRAILVLAGALACVAQYGLFGPARMDVARTVTELAIYGTVLVPFVVLAREPLRARDLAAGALMIGACAVYATSVPHDRSEVGWGTTWFESNANQVDALARDYDIPRPTVATPDLGATSWRKQFNIVDLGKLASAIIPRVDSPGRYLAEVAKPDIIEIHDLWSCQYRDLFTNQQFRDEYVPVAATRTPWLTSNCPAPEALSGIWIRQAVKKGSGTRERAFLDLFRTSRDPSLVRSEISHCVGLPGAAPCLYVARTLMRFVPELKRAGTFARIATLLAREPHAGLEHAYVTSSRNPTWWKTVLAIVEPARLKPGDRMDLHFAASEGNDTAGATTPEQVLVLERTHAGAMPWTASADRPWLDVTPRQGTTPTVLTIAVHPSLMSGASRVEQGEILLAFGSDAPRPQRRLRVSLAIVDHDAPPFGWIDAPPGTVSVQTSSIHVAGWALDDVFVKDVEICLHRTARPPSDAACSDPGKTLLGHATFVEGLRPDVRAAFPAAPFNERAGWSFDMSSDALPRDAHVEISAVARDSAGHWAVLNRSLTLDTTKLQPK